VLETGGFTTYGPHATCRIPADRLIAIAAALRALFAPPGAPLPRQRSRARPSQDYTG
jgi:hypothetical protein